MLDRRNSLAEQINVSGLVWLLLAQLAVILPYTSATHLWVLPALAFSVGWRALALTGRVNRPNNLLKFLLVLIAFGGFAASNGLTLTLQSMVSLLLLAFAFKSIETDNRRDALVVIWVAYFLIAARFLFDQSIAAAVYGVVSMACVTTTLVAVQNPNSSGSIYSRLRLGVGMLLMCLPLMLMIFVTAPRLPPLWSVPDLSAGPQTGVSDSMTPGDIADLSQSANLAFRVAFESARPAQNELYWRGMVMSHFDGKTWRPFGEPVQDEQLRRLFNTELPQGEVKSTAQSRQVDYELLMEPSGQPWLFTLASVSHTQPSTTLGFDYRAISDQKISSPSIYKVRSLLGSQRDLVLNPWVRELSLQLPAEGNEKTRQLAQQMRIASANAAEYVDRVMSRYTQEPYHYTLKPPTLGEVDTIDRFLFESLRGFCAHYAGSFVFMMRAAGIPARVVVGYQGGEWNAKERYFSVRQYDAHAWAEVWLADKGWIRFDPTARVAPNRVEQNLREAMREEGSFLDGSPFALSRYQWLTGVRQSWDAIQYRWRKIVINYDTESQLAFLTSLLGKLTSTKVAIAAGGSLLAIVLLWGYFLGLFQRGAPVPAQQKLYNSYERLLAKKKLPRDSGTTPAEHARDAAERWPALADPLRGFVADYDAICYRDGEASREQLRSMRAALRSLYRADWRLPVDANNT